MLELITFIGELFELLRSWRLTVGIGITVLSCWVIFMTIPIYTMKWALIVSVGLIGIYLSFRWQIHADKIK